MCDFCQKFGFLSKNKYKKQQKISKIPTNIKSPLSWNISEKGHFSEIFGESGLFIFVGIFDIFDVFYT